MTEAPQAQPAQIDTPAPAAPAPAPSTPAEAATRLDQLRADPKWTTALLEGGPVQKREWHELHEIISSGDNIDAAMAGVMQPGIIQDSEHLENISFAAHLRELGIRPEVIREALTGPTETKPWRDEVARFKADKMSDAAWVRRLMSGDVEARRQLTLCNLVLTGEIKESS